MWASWAWLSRRNPSAISSLSSLELLDRWCGCVGVGASDVPPLPEGFAIQNGGGVLPEGGLVNEVQSGGVRHKSAVLPGDKKGAWAGGGSGAQERALGTGDQPDAIDKSKCRYRKRCGGACVTWSDMQVTLGFGTAAIV